MPRIEPPVKSDIVNVNFPGSPKKYGYRFSDHQLETLGRSPLQPGDHVVVKTKDGLQVVTVSSVVAKDKATDRELEIATAWIVDKISPVQWGKLPPGETPNPPYTKEEEPDLDALLEELL